MNRLKELRRAAGLTAANLAEKANTFEMRIYAFERRRYQPRPDEAKRIARVLGTNIATLFPEVAARGAK